MEKLYAVTFKLSNEGMGRFLQSRMVVRASSKEEAIRIVVEERGIDAGAITGAGTF